jgi:hypothetical protein
MTIAEAQREMRTLYLDGAVGPFVSGAIWLGSAALGTWGSRTSAVLALAGGGIFIFPLVLLVLRLLGRPASVSRENPLSALAMQVAFTIPLAIPLILAAMRGHPEWFYAGFLIVVGAHYLPFVTLYGLPVYAGAGGLMVLAGFALPSIWPGSFTTGGWVGGAILLILGLVLLAGRARRRRQA